MFTGIIEELGVVRRINSSGNGTDIIISVKEILNDLKIGDSVAVNGPCLTATAIGTDSFTAWVMPETMKKTNLLGLTTGSPVNIERAVTLNSRLGGHMVSGHIDAMVTLTGKRRQGGAMHLSFDTPGHLLRYIVPKGSVALDGVSLTVIDVGSSSFSVGVIPHTASQTTLGQKEVGSHVNLEVDMIGKYVEKILAARPDNVKKEANLTMDLLQEKGYL